MDKNRENNVNKDFQRKSQKVYKNNTSNYTENDFEFLSQLNQMFGNAMSAKGLNVLDPFFANFAHYNKMGMRGNADIPRVTRTYVFFTRPELNFSYENLQAVPFFKWLYSTKVGKMIMGALTDPEYFINCPSVMSGNGANISNEVLFTILNNFRDTMFKFQRDQAKAFKDDTWLSLYNEESSTIDAGKWEAKNSQLFSKDNKTSNKKTQTEDYIENEEEASNVASLNFANLYQQIDIDRIFNDVNDVQTNLKDLETQYKSQIDKLFQDWKAFSSVKTGVQTDYFDKIGIYQGKSIFKALDGIGPGFFSNKIYTTPFIPLLQNCCTQCTGAKDFNLESYQYEEDEFGMSQKVATGMDELWGPGTLSTNFEDIANSPVALMIMTWVMYIHYVSRGYITTTREHVVERILDYTCSIYVFVVGEDGRHIERWGKYTGCYPTTFPFAQQLEHNSTIDQDVLHKFSVSWNYNRYEPMDPNVLTDFNFLSESEWLSKLVRPFWEDLYNRVKSTDGIEEIMETFTDISKADNPVQQSMLKSLRKNNLLWKSVGEEERGISGKIPTTLIEGEHKGDQINMINNYWGGYPYINKGTELIWVLPQFGKNEGTLKFSKLSNSSSGSESGVGTLKSLSKNDMNERGRQAGEDISNALYTARSKFDEDKIPADISEEKDAYLVGSAQ